MATGPSSATATTELFKGKHKVIADKFCMKHWLDKGYKPKGKKAPREEDADLDEIQEEDITENKSNKKSNKKGNKKSTKKVTPKEEEAEELDVNELDEQGLQNFIDDEELDVDLNDYKSIKEKREAVFEAATED